MDIIKASVVLLCDSDTNKPEENIEKLLVRRMEVNTDNTLFKSGVEHLLSLPKEFEVKNFYTQRNTIIDNYGGETSKSELNKTKLCSHICEKIEIEMQKLILANVAKEIDRLLADKEKYFKQK